MTEERIEITVSDTQRVTAIRTGPDGPSADWLVVYAPGAGSNIADPFGVYAARYLAARGISFVRFQFPYMEARQRRPDRPALSSLHVRELEATWRSAIATVRAAGSRIAIGGRSLGGRIASHVVAQGTEVDALALFAYPLHPPATPLQWRDGHLPAIPVPTLFCSGTRDAFATPEELRTAASKVPQSNIHLLEGADHGFAVAKSSGRTREDVWAEALAALEGLARPVARRSLLGLSCPGPWREVRII